MKKMMITLSALLALSSYAQEKKVTAPAAVKTAFATQFPKAQKSEWSLEKEGVYEVEFKISGTEMSANYNPQGKLLETETEIKESELPAAIKAAIAKEFAGYKLEEINKTTDAKGLVTYEFEAEKGKDTFEIEMDAAGKVLKKEAEKENEKEDKKD